MGVALGFSRRDGAMGVRGQIEFSRTQQTQQWNMAGNYH
jgi:hypothetical protein